MTPAAFVSLLKPSSFTISFQIASQIIQIFQFSMPYLLFSDVIDASEQCDSSNK